MHILKQGGLKKCLKEESLKNDTEGTVPFVSFFFARCKTHFLPFAV